MFSHRRFLVVYSAFIILAFAITVCLGILGRAQGAGKATELDRIASTALMLR